MVIIIIPCYNEEKRLRMDAFISFVQADPNCHILFVDDGSSDATKQIIERMHLANPDQFHLLINENNQGKAEAIRRGMLYGLKMHPDYIGFWDADLSTPLEALDSFLRVFKERPCTQVVIGCRLMSLGRVIMRKPIRHYSGRVIATMISIVSGLKIYDSQCGAKLFRGGEYLIKLFSAPFISKWLFDVELLIRLLKVNSIKPAQTNLVNNLFYELPLEEWIDGGGSKIRWTDGVGVPFDLVRIWMWYRRIIE